MNINELPFSKKNLVILTILTFLFLSVTFLLFSTQIKTKFSSQETKIDSSEDFFSQLPQAVVPENIDLKQISGGISENEDPKENKRYIQIKKGTQVEVREYAIKLNNGKYKTIKVLIPPE